MTQIIDREIFFGNPEISGGQISPDGRYISFIKPYLGIRNIWVKSVDAPFEEAHPITADKTRPIGGYFWSRDSNYILYVQDKGGDENFHVYAVSPIRDLDQENKIPSSRDLTPMDGIRAMIMKLPKSDPGVIYIGLNDRDPSWHDLYKISIDSGDRELVMLNEHQLSSIYFDLEDNVRLATRSTPEGGTEIMKISSGSVDSLTSCSFEETLYPIRFKDAENVYVGTNKGSLDLVVLGLMDAESGDIQITEEDPNAEVDLGAAIFSELSDELIATSFTGDQTRIYWKDSGYEEDFDFLRKELSTPEISLTSRTRDENLWIVYAHADIDPGAAYLFDRSSKALQFIYRPRPQLKSDFLCKMSPVRFRSLDDLEIPAYLTLPKSIGDALLPGILLVHGGPWARDYWGYNSFVQFFANRGYVVLQPNFRGSSGFGKAFLNAGNGEWGTKMQDDITAGVKYLIEEGICDPKRIAIVGGSYGGYAALAGLTFTPEVYRCGVSIVGPSNLFTLLESIPPYWETVRKMFYLRLGDPNTKEGKESLTAKSPFFHADKIQVPLLVGQGDNDPRVKTAESDQIVSALHKHGLPVQYLNFPDEGHGFLRPENNMAFIAVMEHFLSKHLEGSRQTEIPAPLDEIIDRVTVDPSSLI